ncbi:hypothetical protein RMATCC62417_13984 [Rhizopus microsporus]|nr:hypothetical protein RMATCC62417_13984 [Rhizopus microsporus]
MIYIKHVNGEVKSHAESDSHYHTNMDLLRLGHFCKYSIDEHKLLASIGIHVVGPLLTFYLMELKADGLYVMQELNTVRMPSCIDDIPSYLTNLSKIKNIIHQIFICKSCNIYWNRNVMAAKNMFTIVESIWNDHDRPDVFTRQCATSNVIAAL